MNHRIVLSALLLLFTAVKEAAAMDDATVQGIRRCRDFIRKTQLEDGAFRVSLKSDTVRIWPYFGNVAARALLVAHKLEAQPEDVVRVRRWLDWYAAHMREDGNIPDFHGTTKSYKPSPKREAIDVYPPTYLCALWRYYQTQPDGIPADDLKRRATLSLRAIELALDPSDNLTWSSVPHRYKYPMDNVDVCIGLTEGARLFEALGNLQQAERCRTLVQRISEAVAKFWLTEKGYFAWAKGTSPKTRTFENPYPDGVVNLYLAAVIEPSQPRLWKNLRCTFADAPRLTPDLWLAAARRCGTTEQIRFYTEAAIKRSAANDLDLQIASRLLLALAGDTAEPTIIPLSLP